MNIMSFLNGAEIAKLTKSTNRRVNRELKKYKVVPPHIESNFVQGDSINNSFELPNNSVHFCLTDPPYGLDKMGCDWKENVVQSSPSTSAKVTHLPSTMKYNRKQSIVIQEWMGVVSEKVYDLLVPGAFFCIFCAPRLHHPFAIAAEKAGFDIKDMYMWVYTSNKPKAASQDRWIEHYSDLSLDAKNKLRKDLHGWKTPQIKSSHEPIVVAQKPLDGTFLENYLKHGVGLVNTNLKVGTSEDKFPSNVLVTEEIGDDMEKYFLVPKPTKEEKGEYNNHKTVKPLSLCEHLIRLHTRKGQIVFDPFAGSGTTLEAARNCKCGYYGIELDETNCDIIKMRLS